MKMDDNKLKRILQEAAEMDADRIMEEVNSDPKMNDVVAPEEIHEKLFQQIREYEATNENANVTLTEEQEELIRLGKKYKKRISRRKYYVLIAAVVCALAIGTVSFGGAEKVIQEVKDMIAGKTQINIDDSNKRTGETKTVSEEEAYEQIDEKFGFYPVQMSYLPEGMEFVEVFVEEEKQSARLHYVDANERSILYKIITNYRTGSVGADIEDTLIQEYEKDANGVIITMQEYLVEESNTSRWSMSFNYQDAQYWILLMGIEEEEVEKIVENLYFS